jgi:hypothetical protein
MERTTSPSECKQCARRIGVTEEQLPSPTPTSVLTQCNTSCASLRAALTSSTWTGRVCTAARPAEHTSLVRKLAQQTMIGAVHPCSVDHHINTLHLAVCRTCPQIMTTLCPRHFKASTNYLFRLIP